MENAITEFRKEYRFLSNFYPCTIEYGGLIYPSVESAYQAQKCSCDADKEKYTRMTNPVKAKCAGKREKTDIKEWEEKAPAVMRELLEIKFAEPVLRKKLQDTGTAELIEGNHWHDNRWGHCTCERCSKLPFENLLGNILMEIRRSI